MKRPLIAYFTRILKPPASNAFRIKLPISKAEFEKGTPITRLEDQVLTFLAERREQAFTCNEIVEQLTQPRTAREGQGSMGYALHWVQILMLLDSLMGKGTVVGKVVEPSSSGKDVYFAKS